MLILHSILRERLSETIYAATRAIGDIRIMEIKGASDVAQVIEFAQEGGTCYFAYQFIGNSVITASGSRQLKSGQHIGCSRAIQLTRLHKAREWLRNPIEHLASELHFVDTAHFVRCYTELFKITPQAERKRRR